MIGGTLMAERTDDDEYVSIDGWIWRASDGWQTIEPGQSRRMPLRLRRALEVGAAEAEARRHRRWWQFWKRGSDG